jgi:hypothetical protein
MGSNRYLPFLPFILDWLGEPFHALHPARGDRPDLGAFDAHRDPWAGDLEGLGGEVTVATARVNLAGERIAAS